MEIQYSGEYPCLCSGVLIVIVNSKKWKFPDHCLSSGGGIGFSDSGQERIGKGNWSVCDWPKKFPEELKDDVIEKVNNEIPQGCCGGCV